LLWNYAKSNSVFAVWNIRKAVYLLGTYTGKYLLNSFIFALFYILNCAIVYAVNVFLIAIGVLSLSLNNFSGLIMCFIVSNLTAVVLYLYSLHVYAYLLATITPVSEG